MMVHELVAKQLQLCTSKCSCSDGSHTETEFICIASFHLYLLVITCIVYMFQHVGYLLAQAGRVIY